MQPTPMPTSGPPAISRRAALGSLARLTFAAFVIRSNGRSHGKPFPHPDPRPDVTAGHVLPDDRLPDKRAVRDAYAAARRSPEMFDGLYCVCDCKESMGHRSLLSCFESTQGAGCYSCQEQATVADEMVRHGKTLADIRRAFDSRWG